jgi:predicted DsbA family dithiol-disulfide isomerase
MDHRLRRALDEFEHGDEVEVVHRSFQLHPDLPREGVTQRELITMAGASPSTVDRVLRPIERSAQAEGFGPYHAVDRKLGPTDLAHEVLAYAADIGRGDEIQQAMFQFHFGKAGNLWTEADLLVFAGEAGLDRDEVRKVLRSRRYKSKVDADQGAALHYGIQGTPFMPRNRCPRPHRAPYSFLRKMRKSHGVASSGCNAGYASSNCAVRTCWYPIRVYQPRRNSFTG